MKVYYAWSMQITFNDAVTKWASYSSLIIISAICLALVGVNFGTESDTNWLLHWDVTACKIDFHFYTANGILLGVLVF